MADSYVCSKALIKCSFGDRISTLTVYPDRTIWLAGQPQANISDHIPLKNIAPFGKCHTVTFPPTGSATAANHGHLTPMPCMPSTPFRWTGGKNDVLLKGEPALLKSSVCYCAYGGRIEITYDGQQVSPLLNGIVGAQPVRRQDFSCEIVLIKCKYKYDREDKNEELYNRQRLLSAAKQVPDPSISANQTSVGNKGSESTGDESKHTNELYFISDHKGKDIELINLRKCNNCSEEAHTKYLITRIEGEQTGEDERAITEGKLKLYYHDIFYRRFKYAKDVGRVVAVAGCIGGGVTGAIAGGSVGAAVGGVAGDIADIASVLRYFCLPDINHEDADYCGVKLNYHTCPDALGAPQFIINIYPDIKYSLKISPNISMDFHAQSYDFNRGRESNDELKFKPLTLEFSASYAGSKKTFDLSGPSIEEELDPRASVFYKAIKDIEGFCKNVSELPHSLKKIFGGADGGKPKLKSNRDIAKSRSLIRGELEIEPSVTLDWNYSISKGMTKLRRQYKFALGIEATGKLIVDLIEVTIKAMGAAKKVTTAAAIGSAAFTGGISVLVKGIVDVIIAWLIRQFKQDNLTCELRFFVKIGGEPVTFDTESEPVVGIGEGKLSLGIEFYAGLKFKTSKTIIWMTKMECEAKGEASAETSCDITAQIQDIDEYWGVRTMVILKPMTIKIEVGLAGSLEFIRKSESEKGSKGKYKSKWSKECKFKEYSYGPYDFKLIRRNDKDKGSYGGGKTTGGGSSSSIDKPRSPSSDNGHGGGGGESF
ncbi:MAG: DUF4280 domain-containing protein [Paramuribaculum sp.]|nr:DUF4280 domain-containing protein [Paramuribaculum sp.]